MAQTQTTAININDVLEQVAREKDIDLERWITALEDAMASAAKKQHRIKAPVRSIFDFPLTAIDAFLQLLHRAPRLGDPPLVQVALLGADLQQRFERKRERLGHDRSLTRR